MIAYRQIGDSFIPAQHQPALILDYARSRELDEQGDKALRGTGLTGWEMPDADIALSPAQYLQLRRMHGRLRFANPPYVFSGFVWVAWRWGTCWMARITAAR